MKHLQGLYFICLVGRHVADTFIADNAMGQRSEPKSWRWRGDFSLSCVIHVTKERASID